MHKRISLLLAGLAVALAACQGATQSAPGTAGAILPTNTSPDSTVTAPPPSATTSNQPDQAAQCTVVSPPPTPGPTEQSLFPPASASDWTSGPDTAAVTIIEYSDFQ
jgi:hypothetical protein